MAPQNKVPLICKTCYYRRRSDNSFISDVDSRYWSDTTCDYIIIEHEPRGCPGDENCTKYKCRDDMPKRPRKRPMAWRGPGEYGGKKK